MFNKSLLAAALLIAGGTAANAAEIGVRHTWGNSTRMIDGGTSSYTRIVSGQYSEDSAGFALGIDATEFSTGEFANSVSEGSVDGTLTADFGHSRINGTVDLEGSRYRATGFGRGIIEGATGTVDLDLAGAVLDGTFTGTSKETSNSESGYFVDGSLAVSGSGYIRHEGGTINETATETYNFGGSSTQNFSELSTFSR